MHECELRLSERKGTYHLQLQDVVCMFVSKFMLVLEGAEGRRVVDLKGYWITRLHSTLKVESKRRILFGYLR